MIKQQCTGFLNTPPLWQNEQFGMHQFEFPEIDLTTFQPKAIPDKLRLGHQMEYVFKQLVEYSSNYEVLLHNLPVKRGKQTIGEIDFILRNLQTRVLIHIELTYKFYIINPQISEPLHQLIGPNKRDMFFAKVEKIKNRQFKLLHSKEGITALTDHNIEPSKIKHQTCFKGQLFQPYVSNSLNINPLNTSCISGYWLRFDDLKSGEFKQYQFYIPSKSEWVIAPHTAVHWKSHAKILLDLKLWMLQENAPMLWNKKSETEFEKFFVVWW